MTTRIKLCGIDTPGTAALAAELGVTAIGINHIPGSPRCRTPIEARAIADAVRGRTCIVMLFADAPVAVVASVIEQVQPDLLQFHGSEEAAYCEQFELPFLKAVPADGDLTAVRETYAKASGWLLDTAVQGQFGGTGVRFDWTRFPRETTEPWILAGGLNPENVGEAIATARPWAVDVSSGIEGGCRGVKDAARMRAFCAAVATADEALAEQR